MIVGPLLGIVIGLIGWWIMVKGIPGSLIGSLLAGIAGGFFGSAFIGGIGIGKLWYVLLCGVIGAAVLVVIVNLIIHKVNAA